MAEPAISVLGLGYVGCVAAACFASRGHAVHGVDVEPTKVDLLSRGVSPIVEDGIGDLVREVVAGGLLTVSTDTRKAVLDSDVTLICVGTPSGTGGRLSTVYLERVTEEIGLALRDKQTWHTVAYRSTMLPGTVQGLLIPLLERTSGKQVGVDFGVCVNPEFLREGSSVRDFFEPPKTVVGESDEHSGDVVMGLYDGLPGPRFRVPVGVAEITKYVDNSWHALKVDFGNEIGAVCAELGLDSHRVMEIFVADTKLNISAAYLRPGFAFGGSCLPKDVRALVHMARSRDVEVPVLDSLLASNQAHLTRVLDLVMARDQNRVGVFGLGFKSGTDDLRESPMVELVERLLGKGLEVRVYDPNVAVSRLLGANKAYMDERLAHLTDLLTDDPDEVVQNSDVIVVAANDVATVAAISKASPQRFVLDLVRLPEQLTEQLRPDYAGIAW